MPFYKFLKMWLIPPGAFVLAFLVLAIYLGICAYLSNQKEKFSSKMFFVGSVICACFSITTYLLSVNAIAQRFLHSIEYKYSTQQVKTDAILVLGGNASVRAKAAIVLYNRYKVDIITSGYHGEAERIKRILKTANVPENKIILEPLATNTKEHVKYLLPIVLENGYKKVFVVTDASHMFRSMAIIKKAFTEKGIDVIPYPCGHITPKNYQRMFGNEWIPDIRNLELSTIAWHEYLGILELWLFK